MINNLHQQTSEPSSRRRLPSTALLAAAFIMLVLPAVAPVPFAAAAQVQAPCRWPRQGTCTYSPEGLRFYNYIDNLAYSWMRERGLPPDDLNGVIRRYAREDLAADIDAYIAANILTAIDKPADKRTDDESLVVSWFQDMISSTELNLYNAAVQDAEFFLRDPCNWKPDPEIAAVYGLEYDGTPYCYNDGLATTFRFFVPGPHIDYIKAHAFRNSYGYLRGNPLVASIMQERVGEHLEALGAATTVGGVAGGIVGNNVSKFVPNLFKSGYSRNPLTEAARVAFKLRYLRFLGGGAFTIVTFMADIGIEAIIAFAEEVKFQQDLDSLRATRDRLKTSGVNLIDVINGEQGLQKIMLAINSQAVLPGPEPLPQYRPGVDRVFITEGQTSALPHESLDLTDHAGVTWNVHMWGNYFVRTATLDGGTNVESITPELEVVDGNGVQWLATRVGPSGFRMTQVDPPDTAKVCPSVNGISATRDSSCSVYYSNSIKIKLPSGQVVSVNLGIAPLIVNTADSYFFPDRTSTSIAIQVSGQPTPVLQATGLPSWLRLLNGSLTGDPGTQAGKIQIGLSVQTPAGTDKKTVTIYYGQPIQFMSPATVDITQGQPFQFLINAAGTPRPTIRLTGWTPQFVAFKDNGNGTATLSGLWTGGSPPMAPCTGFLDISGAVQNNCPPTIVASNQAQSVGQLLVFSFHAPPPAPNAKFQGPSEVKFIAGLEGRYLLTTSGAQTPVLWQSLFGSRLSDVLRQSLPWLRLEEHSDGTALLYGTPPMDGQSNTTGFNVCALAQGSQLAECGVIGVGNLRVTVDGAPRFQSDTYASVRVGSQMKSRLFVNRINGSIGLDPAHSSTNQFPDGLNIVPQAPGPNGMVHADINGAPQPGQGGRYNFVLNWTDQVSSVTSPFQIDVVESAKITSPDSFTFFEGTNAVGQVTTQGYPVNSTGVDCGSGKDCADMKIRMQWVGKALQGLTLTDRNPQGIPTGVGNFGGLIPTGSSGVYISDITAANGPLAPGGVQRVRIVVRPTADLNGDGKVDCGDLTAIKGAVGRLQSIGLGFDLTGDGVVDNKDIDAMVRAIPNLFACQI